MKNLKQYLIEEVNKKIKETKEEIRQSDENLEILEAKLKVEKKFLEMQDIEEKMRENINFSVQFIESDIITEKERNVELKDDLKMLLARERVINKFEDGGL